MKYVFDIRIPAIILVALLILGATYLIERLQNDNHLFQQEQLQLEAKKDLLVIRANLEANIYSDIYYANSLATLASANPDSTAKDWAKIAKELVHKARNIRNIGMAPDDIIRFVYPLKGNEKAIGLDFRTVPAQWSTVKKARDLQAIFIAGPVNLVQGGLGLIARNPIFIDPPNNTQYWGTCSVVLDVDALFRNSGIYEISDNYPFAIRGVDGEGRGGQVFFGNEQVFDNVFASEEITLPSGSWYMAVSSSAYQSGFSWYQQYSARIVGYPLLLVLLLMYAAIYYFYHVAHTHSLQDELTKLPNRRYFIYTLEQLVESAQKNESYFTLLNLDLNDFKLINDTYGHVVGDVLLIEVANRIKQVIRASDVAARVGGDEFLILFPRVTEENDIKHIIHSLHSAISDKAIQTDSGSLYPRVSIGYAIYNEPTINVDAILHMADTSMYQQKKLKGEQ